MVGEGVAAEDVTVGSELQAEGGLEECVAPKNGIEEAENENEPSDLDGLGRLIWHGIEGTGVGYVDGLVGLTWHGLGGIWMGYVDGLVGLTWYGIECVGLGLWKSHPLGRPEKLR